MLKKLLVLLIGILSLCVTSPASAYTVKSGDTLTKIASRSNLSLKQLAKRNPQIENLDLIFPGQVVHTDMAEPKPKKQEMVIGYFTYELDLLARLVRAEAQGEPFEGKVAVACVVLNRVDHSAYPNTIEGVIYEKGQFQPVRNGAINKPADEDSIKAVQSALNEKRQLAADSLFFYNPAIATSRWLDTRATTLAIGNHVFKK